MRKTQWFMCTSFCLLVPILVRRRYLRIRADPLVPEGYEREFGFQLLAFAISELPLLLLGLAAALAIETLACRLARRASTT